MTTEEYEELSAAEKEHFMKCPDCGEMFDRRSLDEGVFHHDRKHRADFPYQGPGKRIGPSSN